MQCCFNQEFKIVYLSNAPDMSEKKHFSLEVLNLRDAIFGLGVKTWSPLTHKKIMAQGH